MNRIRLLPEQVANQIAAGEVVERPASVVKELVENSLDAGARRVTVEIQAGGRSLIRVTDDGTGMSRDDALLCLERHATSKIRRAEDLAAITSMGFRGEALPGIASVSRFTLTTRERDSDSPEGTQIVISGGKIIEVKSAGSAPGTSVEVRQLFFNLPARRKFLRTEETESAHIQHYLTLAALAFPEVAFAYHKDGRLVWQLAAVKSGEGPGAKLTALDERLRALIGNEQRLLPVDFTTPYSIESEEPDANYEQSSVDHPPSSLRVWGYLGSPGVSRANREDQHLFVNRRPVENRGLNFALLEGYHTALMKGRYPVCCLFLEIDPGAVDVNIHPAKREVKFHREAEVRRFVAQAVRETLLQFHREGQSEKDEMRTDLRAPVPGTIDKNPEAAPAPTPAPPLSLPFAPLPSDFAPPEQPPLKMGFGSSVAGSEFRIQGSKATLESESTEHETRTTPAPSFSPVPLLNVPLRLVGIIGKLYVVLESDRGLVLLDQHAAHERILFEQMLNRLERNEQAPSQKLLLPETVELSARDAAFLRTQLPVLSRLGVGLSDFGERTFLLDALPPFIKATDPRRYVVELVDELKAAGAEVNSLRLGEHTVAKTVCRHAVKANDPLAGPELESLVNDLRRCVMPYTCPHGRPTVIEMNYRELERKFGRSA